MTELIWLNGKTIPISEARISPEDRGFQFADGVYEVIRLYAGKPFTLEEHLARLEKSAAGIQLAVPLTRTAIKSEIEKFIPGTGVGDGMIYLQLTRGHAPRNHLFPQTPGSTLLFYARPLDALPAVADTPRVKLVAVADERWKRCWIKSIALLPNVLAKNAAISAGADEAVFVEDGMITECSASNFFVVIKGKLVTHPVGPKVLPGITRAVLLDCAKEIGIGFEERPLRLEEARKAEELFITSTTREISPVAAWDGKAVGTGKTVTIRLHHALKNRVIMDTF
jgi:D-alanine transaminase